MGKKVVLLGLLLIIIAIVAICVYFMINKNQETGEAEKSQGQSGEQAIVDANISGDDSEKRYGVYYSVLKEYYFNNKWPDSTNVEHLEYSSDEDKDAFAIFDVDSDGKDELIIRHSDGTMADSRLEVYDYDAENEWLVYEFYNSQFCTFYKNGFIRCDDSHNQGRAFEFMWPYTLFKYIPENDVYSEYAYINGWDKKFDEYFPAYIESGESFPDEIDKDKNGGIYKVFMSDEDEGRYIDDVEYEEWLNENVGELEAIDIPYIVFSAESIKKTFEKYDLPEEDKWLFEDYYDEANAIVKNMTIEEKIAQMFLVLYPGDSKALEEIKKYNPGGYILFAKDVKDETKESLKEKIQKLQDASKVKMMIAVDEEGGRVVRVSGYSQFRDEAFKYIKEIYKNGGVDAVIADSKDKSEFLLSYGINMNLTPVVDLPTNDKSYMYDRAIDIEESVASEFAEKIIKQMNEDNMLSSMKHFPGYGDNVDTHTGIAIDERTIEDFYARDFKPFIAGIKAKAPTIMVNHNILKNVDEKYPASISERVHEILRYDLGYSGLIITDALSMDAIKQYVDNGEAAAQAVIAGNDMILSGTLEAHIQEILNALRDGRISQSQIDTAARRVVACKLAYKIK